MPRLPGWLTSDEQLPGFVFEPRCLFSTTSQVRLEKSMYATEAHSEELNPIADLRRLGRWGFSVFKELRPAL
jgi:hypothetical protein